MRYFPIFLDLEGQTVLVAGGGAAAANKLRLFAKSGARLRCAALDFNEEIIALAASGRVAIERIAPADVSLDGAFIVIAATESSMDETIALRARDAGLLVNAVDKTRLCTFITPSIVDRGSVAVAIGTEGAAPVLARRLRERVEIGLPDNLGALADFIGKNRGRVGEVLHGTPRRRAFWEAVVDGEIGRLVLAGRVAEAEDGLARALAASEEEGGRAGPPARVTILISPAHPEDLTIKAVRALQDADLIISESDVPAAIIDRARRDAERKWLRIGAGSGADASLEAFEAAVIQASEDRKRIVCVFSPEVRKNAGLDLARRLRGRGYDLDVCAVAVPVEYD